jgi:molybdate transport system ATP-binding protein
MTDAAPGQATPFITLQDVTLHPATPPIRWEIRADQQWAVVGPNGSGKTTLVQVLGGRRPPAGGRIVYHFNGASRPQERFAYMDFQGQKALLGWPGSFYQARWNSLGSQESPTVSDCLSERAVKGLNPFQVIEDQADPVHFAGWRREVVDLLGISPLLERRVGQLSGGERRKVVLARALLREPALLILDNPFTGLDQAFRARLFDVVATLARGQMRLMVVVAAGDDLPPGITHILSLDAGRVVAMGPYGSTLPRSQTQEPSSLRATEAISTVRQPGHCEGAPSVPEAISTVDGQAPAPQSSGIAAVDNTASIAPLARNDRSTDRPAPDILVHMQSVHVSYGDVTILDGIDWTVRRGERWALLGPNGAGKTTLLSLILGDNPQAYANRISLFGRRRGSGESIWDIKRQAGWVAPELHLSYPRSASCLDVACSGLFDSLGLYRRCSPEQQHAALSWLERLEVASLAGTAFDAVSEGQQRLVLIARAMVKEPALMVLDEPCQGLDTAHRRRVLAAVDAIAAGRDTAIIYVTHDPHALPEAISHELRLDGGRVVARGPME